MSSNSEREGFIFIGNLQKKAVKALSGPRPYIVKKTVGPPEAAHGSNDISMLKDSHR